MSAYLIHSIKSSSRTPVLVDSIASHPALIRANWDTKTLIGLIRSEVIQGHQETATKLWITYSEDVFAALETRNESIARGLINLDSFSKEGP